jgi:predicted nucleic acid-binding protein
VALEGDADYLVSGDDDLLSLDSYEGTAVVTPDEFLMCVE